MNGTLGGAQHAAEPELHRAGLYKAVLIQTHCLLMGNYKCNSFGLITDVTPHSLFRAGAVALRHCLVAGGTAQVLSDQPQDGQISGEKRRIFIKTMH